MEKSRFVMTICSVGWFWMNKQHSLDVDVDMVRMVLKGCWDSYGWKVLS